jgi:hypothetical protein
MAQRQPKGGVLYQLLIVLQADPLRRLHNIVIGKAIVYDTYNWVQNKDRGYEQGGREKKVWR